MVSNEVKKFNSLKRTKMAPSGLVPNVWHFDIRYIHLEPHPGHVLFLFQPESEFIHLEHLGGVPNGSMHSYEYFPESADQAAPEVVNALIRSFNNGFAQKGIPTQTPELRAPWSLKTEDKNFAVAVGKELARVGVTRALCTIESSPKRVTKAATMKFMELFVTIAGGLPSSPLQMPNSIAFDYNALARAPEYDDPSNDGELSEINRVLQYVRFLDSCSPYTKEKLDGAWHLQMAQTIQQSEQMLKTPIEELIEQGEEGNISAFIDCAARYYLGLGCVRDRQLCRKYLLQAAFHPLAHDATRATAHAMITRWCHEATDEAIRTRYLYASLHHACLAVKFARSVAAPGHSIPQILFAFKNMTPMLVKDNPDVKKQYPEVFRALREADERFQRDTQTTLKRMKQPLRYRCATLECGIEADHGRMLSRCAGKCDEDKKPHYCSRECQRKDWPNHKPFCKPGQPCSVIDAGKALKAAPFGGSSKQGQRSMVVNTPGGEMSLSSSTMSAEFMKEVREGIEKISVEGDPEDQEKLRRAMASMDRMAVETFKLE
ncbi:MYND-type domain-containing protein [Mycena indigotica]|uniref:MYND-type domain-containing protein n=1 Tax=Mycena indigotica TaxID=2126181 RepID=A0A8H6TFJ7_9AGAR|nr:MYND-type domain-containing protein [Mycena indigotica]KAF7315777.1 MYND-type domain-containing protein [Mycena indigotica]